MSEAERSKPPVPQSVMDAVFAYGDARAGSDPVLPGKKLGELIILLRNLLNQGNARSIFMHPALGAPYQTYVPYPDRQQTIREAIMAGTDALETLRRGYGVDVSQQCFPALNLLRDAVEALKEVNDENR